MNLRFDASKTKFTITLFNDRKLRNKLDFATVSYASYITTILNWSKCVLFYPDDEEKIKFTLSNIWEF